MICVWPRSSMPRRSIVPSTPGSLRSERANACWRSRQLRRGVQYFLDTGQSTQPAPSPAPGARLGAAAEPKEPREEGWLVNQQLPARGIEDSVAQSVHRAAPQRPGDTIDAEQMRVFGNELGFCDELPHRGNGGRSG